MAYEKTTVTADAPPSSDDEILARIRELAMQPRQPLAPMTPIRDPAMLAIAGGFVPGFRQGVVDPLLAERQMRPQMEQAYADEGNQQEIRNLTGLQEMTQRQGYLDMAQGDRDRARQQEDLQMQQTVARVSRLGGEMQKLFGAASRQADIFEQSTNPLLMATARKIRANMEVATMVYQEMLKDPTVVTDDDINRLFDKYLDSIWEDVDEANENEAAMRALDAENKAKATENRSFEEFKSGLRIKEEEAKAKTPDAARLVPPPAVKEMGEAKAAIGELDRVESLFNELGAPAGPFAGRGWSENSAKFRSEWEGITGPLRTALTGSAQGVQEVERISHYIATTDNIFLAKEKIINSINALRNHLRSKREGQRQEFKDFGFYVPEDRPSFQLPEGATMGTGLTKNGKKWYRDANGDAYEIDEGERK